MVRNARLLYPVFNKKERTGGTDQSVLSFLNFNYSLNFELFFAKSFINSTSFSTASYGIEL